MTAHSGYIYILTNTRHTVLYVGVTSNLVKRIWEHQQKVVPGFTAKYHLHKLVYYENVENIAAAIAREKQLKGGSRQKKIDLITAKNPAWTDLYESIL